MDCSKLDSKIGNDTKKTLNQWSKNNHDIGKHKYYKKIR